LEGHRNFEQIRVAVISGASKREDSKGIVGGGGEDGGCIGWESSSVAKKLAGRRLKSGGAGRGWNKGAVLNLCGEILDTVT